MAFTKRVREEVDAALKEILTDYHTGIIITSVVMQPARAPDEVKPAFDDAIKAQEDEQRFINEAQAYAARVEPIARGQGERILHEADAYKQQVTLDATGEAARFTELLSAYEKAPVITRERLYIEALSEVLSNTSKILIDVEGGNNLFYLPLDRMLEQSKAQPEQAADYDANNSSMTPQSSRLGRSSFPGRNNSSERGDTN